MNATELLAQARDETRDGDYDSAFRTLERIDGSELSPEEQDRMEAGRHYIQQRMALLPPVQRIATALRRASADPELWADKPQTGGAVPYLSWQTVAKLLDEHAPGWQHRVASIIETDTAVTVTCEIEIAGVRRQASCRQDRFGERRDGSKFAYTAPTESAERRAMVRAATLFGCGAEPPTKPSRRSSNRR